MLLLGNLELDENQNRTDCVATASCLVEYQKGHT
jgi:hypothetical protein